MSEAHREADYRVNVEAFRAFYDGRPDGEKWELIDGEVLLNPAPTNRHQIILRNLLFVLEGARRDSGATWQAFPGIGVTNPADEHNQLEPDVMITPAVTEVTNWTSDVLVTFEILSPFTMRRDLVQKRDFYINLPGLTHYVVLAQDRREATVFARTEGFSLRILKGGDTLELPELGISVPLADIYRDVNVG